MEIISNRILQMAESETLAMTQIARELKAQGKDVISLSIGEPDFNTPESVKEAANAVREHARKVKHKINEIILFIIISPLFIYICQR